MAIEWTDASFGNEVAASQAPVVRDLFALAAEPTSWEARTGWVPGETCTLPTADQPLRLAEFDDLFSAALRAVERQGPTWLRLRLTDDEGVEEQTRDLVARETDCCDFFAFSIHRAADETIVDVRVPAARAAVLDGLALQATTAGSGR